MKAYYLLVFLFAITFSACTSRAEVARQSTTYDPNSPVVNSSPTPTTSSDLPTSAANKVAAPATYGSPGMMPRSVEAAPTTYSSVAAVSAPVIGSWVNNTDPDETVLFTDHSYITYYENQLVIEEEMTYHIQCPSDCSGGVSSGIPCFTITSEFGTDCFGIVKVTENELELIMLGVSTETVKYSRKFP